MNEIVPVRAHVRLARLEDGAAIVDLIAAVAPHDDANARARRLETLAALTMAADARVLLAEGDGVIVGVACLQARASLLTGRREGSVGVLALAPAERSGGIDAQLLAAAEHHARALGCDSIVLESPATQLERALEPPTGTLADRFLAAAARAATRVAEAIAGRASAPAIGIGADGAPTEAADAAAERAALRELLPLGIPVVSEESGLVGAASVDPEQPWISLDPLDGSRNFVAGYPAYAVSIGLVQHGQPIAGLVADLAGGGHRWSAKREGGAFRDGRPIRTRRGPLGGLPSPVRAGAIPRELPDITRVRMSGSTASDLCRVADGSLAVFFALDRPVVHVHDLAAAMIIIEEAGGAVIDRAGVRPVLTADPARTLDVVAAYDHRSARDFAGLA